MSLSPEDHLAITQLYVRYNHTIDFGQPAEWAANFLDDGTLEANGTVTEGNAGLVEFCTVTQEMVPGIRHLVTNILIEGEGDNATGCGYLQATAGAGAERSTLITGRYHDTITRTADGWKFASRRLEAD